MTRVLKPDAAAIQKHLTFLFSDMSDYDDGKIEISILNQAEHFSVHELDKATACAVKWNEQGHSVYVCGVLIDPDAAPFGRSSDADFYASSVIWADIDEPHDPDALKQLYAAMPPSVAVITARTPHRRLQMWWKLAEPLTDAETLRESLQGAAQALGGDVKVTNPVRLMRLAGTINYPTEKKRSAGRTEEQTEYHVITKQKYDIDAFLKTYAAHDFSHAASVAQEMPVLSVTNPFLEQITDGRDKYMSDMLWASIINMTSELGRWPTAQEVYDDTWPVYSRKVTGRNGRSLDQDGRGQRLMVSKIKSKLSAFQRGKVKGMETPDMFPKTTVKTPQILHVQAAKEEIDPETGEVIETAKNTALLPYTWAYDIKPQIDANDFVEGLLGTGQFSVVYGESNCGKTFFMTDLAFHVAIGRKWREKRVDQGGVVYVALEGGFGLKNRIAAFMQENMTDAAGMPFAVITTQIDFLDPNGNLGAFIETVKDVAEKVGNVKLIVIDTLARAISGGDENSSQDMGRLVGHADIIREVTGAHVCFVHHSGKDRARGARGHSSLRAAVDTEIEVSRAETDDFSAVKIVKQRDMEIGGEMFFALKTVCVGVNKHNEEVKSCIVVERDAPEKSKIAKEESLNGVQQFVYDALLETIMDCGKERIPKNGMSAIKCVTYDQLADKMEEMGFKDLYNSDGKNTVKSATNTVRAALRRKNLVGYNGGLIWVIN